MSAASSVVPAAGDAWLDLRQPHTRAFLLVWLGQTVSAFGSALTSFALSVWVYQQSQSLLQFGLVVFAHALTIAVAAPWLGLLCDRQPRHRLMLIGDAGAALLTVGLLLLVAGGGPRLWQVIVLVAGNAVFSSLHQTAYRAVLPVLVAPHNLLRANGLIETGLAAGTLLAPLAGGFLLAAAGLLPILVVDLSTFTLALICLLLARLDRWQPATATLPAAPGRWQEISAGWRLLHADASLRALLQLVLLAGLVMASLQVLFTPLVLARHDSTMLGVLLSAGGLGMAAGGLFLLWRRGGPGTAPVRVAQLAMGLALVGLGLARAPALLGLLLFLLYAASQCGSAAARSIWQLQIAAPLRGRAFACIGALSALLLPPACLGAPWLAEWLQRWLQQPGADWAATLFGRAPGSGAALLVSLLGLSLLACTALLGRGRRWHELDSRLAAAAQHP